MELTNKINSIQNSLNDLKTQESKKSNFDFDTFMEWADNYFIQKNNVYLMASDLEYAIDLDDCCRVDLSLCGNEIEIENEIVESFKTSPVLR